MNPHGSNQADLHRRWRDVPATMVDTARDACRPPRVEGEEPIVRLRNVSKAFGPLRVLSDVSIDFYRGETTVILGPSGTGKSVLLKHIVGLMKPDAGEVLYDGERVDQLPPAELVDVRKKIGFLFQMSALFDSLSVGQNVEFPLVEHTKLNAVERAERADRVLRMVGLSGLQKQMPADLSGGQRKRVALARAIVMEPELILYDEPTTGLDPIRSDLINELIIGLNRKLGVSSIVVTHDMVSAQKIADRMLLLYNGHVICDGDWETFRRSDDPLVQRFIQGQADVKDLDLIRRGLEQASEASQAKDAATPRDQTP